MKELPLAAEYASDQLWLGDCPLFKGTHSDELVS